MLLLAVPSAFAAEHTIRIVDSDAMGEPWQFEPRDLTIDVGDTVRFIDDAPAGHTATSDDAGFDHDFNGQAGDTFRFTFPEQGIFDYFCEPHNWMGGTITVEAASATSSTTSTTRDPGTGQTGSTVSGGDEPGDDAQDAPALAAPWVLLAMAAFALGRRVA